MANGTDGSLGLPWWVRAIALIGIPGAIAVYLVWIGATEVPQIKAEELSIKTEVIENQRLMREHAEDTAAIYRMLVRVCSNTAKTEFERQRCFEK